eukprot:5079268-Karenia_brevis.AAC.3
MMADEELSEPYSDEEAWAALREQERAAFAANQAQRVSQPPAFPTEVVLDARAATSGEPVDSPSVQQLAGSAADASLPEMPAVPLTLPLLSDTLKQIMQKVDVSTACFGEAVPSDKKKERKRPLHQTKT